MKIEPTYVEFEQAKLLKEKGFDIESNCFYTKSNSKMFGIDDHGEVYPIKNTPKKLYIIGSYASLNEKNVFIAPEQWQVIEWLRIVHSIWIGVEISNKLFAYRISAKNNNPVYSSIETKHYSLSFYTPQEAYSVAIDYTLNNLI